MAIAEFLEADTVVLIPLAMWMEVLDTQQEGVEKHEASAASPAPGPGCAELDDRGRPHPHRPRRRSDRPDAATPTSRSSTPTWPSSTTAGTRASCSSSRTSTAASPRARSSCRSAGRTCAATRRRSYSRALQDANEDSCRTTVLVDEGFLDLDELRRARHPPDRHASCLREAAPCLTTGARYLAAAGVRDLVQPVLDAVEQPRGDGVLLVRVRLGRPARRRRPGAAGAGVPARRRPAADRAGRGRRPAGTARRQRARAARSSPSWPASSSTWPPR